MKFRPSGALQPNCLHMCQALANLSLIVSSDDTERARTDYTST
jgi:hypothetical protein